MTGLRTLSRPHPRRVHSRQHVRLRPCAIPVRRPVAYCSSVGAIASSRVEYHGVDTYDASGLWPCPLGVYWVQVEVNGEGGAGRGGRGLSSGGGGGRAGDYVINPAYPVVPGVSYAITVFTGRAGGAYNDPAGTQALSGRACSFDGAVVAAGGEGGGPSGDWRLGGTAAVGTSAGGTVTPGGNGVTAASGLATLGGAGGDSPNGGTGGAGGNPTGGNGVAPGGGGGGGRGNTSSGGGGNSAGGRVRLTY